MIDLTAIGKSKAKRVRWVLQGTRYKGACLAVFVDLAERSNENALCWPSLKDIELDTRCSRRSIQYAIHQLAKDGWIQIYFQRGRGGANLYALNLEKMEKAYELDHARRQLRHGSAPEKNPRIIELPVPPAPVEVIPPAAPSKAPRTTRISFLEDETPCGNVEDNPLISVDNQWNTRENSLDEPVLRVQSATSRGATTARKGCNPLHPNPKEPPGNPNNRQKAKACYYGENDRANGRDPPISP